MSRAVRASRAVRWLIICLVGHFLAAETAHAATRDLFVSSRNTSSVKRYDGETGAYLGDFVAPGAGGLNTTQECLFTPEGALLVTGIENEAVLEYDGLTGAFVAPFTSGYALANPTKTMFGPDGDLYVSQWGGSEKVVRFDGANGSFIEEFTSTGVSNGCGQAWDGDGNLYVAFYGSGNDGGVQKFDAGGTSLGSAVEAGHLLGPVNVWLGDGGDLFVLDWTQGIVQRFDASGSFLETFISGLSTAEGFVFGPDGYLYICDWSANQVNRYELDGTFESVFASGGGLFHPNGVTFGPEQVVDVPEETPAPAIAPQAAPNPFRGSTSLRFQLRAAADVSVDIFGAAGQRVATLDAGALPGGTHRLAWDARAFPAGVYVFRLVAGDAVFTDRLVHLR